MRLTARLGAAAKALRATPPALELFSKLGGSYFSYPRSSAYVDGAFSQYQSASYAHIYSTQENVRIVVDAISSASVKRALKCYERYPDGTKEEDSDFEAAETMRYPNDWQSQRELLEALVRDKLIFDDAFLWDMGADTDGRRFLMRVPPFAMGVSSTNSMTPSGYTVKFADGVELPLTSSEVIHWRGYNPSNNRSGVSKLETLRVLLTESAVRKAQSIDMIRGGLIKGGIVTRALDAPEWSNAARERFQESFSGRLKGTTKGEVALLEDGMQFMEAGITPREAEMMASRQWELAITANIYGVNPSLFSTDGNLAQAREMLDEDAVEPLTSSLADCLTTQLIRGTYGDDMHFFRFRPPRITDISALFEAGSKATGGSTMTANEFREDYLDMSPIDGGDEIVKHPGSQGGSTPAAPGSDPRGRPELPAEDAEPEKFIRQALIKTEMDKQTKLAVLQGKAEDNEIRRQVVVHEHTELMQSHFNRQAKQQKSGQWPTLNRARWDRELSSDLLDLAVKTVAREGSSVAAALGGLFDVSLVENYLTVGSVALAKSINAQTYTDVAEAMKNEEKDIASVYQKSADGRAGVLAETRATQLMSFATLEAGKQLSI